MDYGLYCKRVKYITIWFLLMLKLEINVYRHICKVTDDDSLR